jgi:hypothetical protein
MREEEGLQSTWHGLYRPNGLHQYFLEGSRISRDSKESGDSGMIMKRDTRTQRRGNRHKGREKNGIKKFLERSWPVKACGGEVA